MSTTVAPESTQSADRSLSTAFAVGAVLSTLGSVGYISLNGMPPREAFEHPVNVVSGIVAMTGILLVSLGLVRWRTTLPGWALGTSAAGLFIAAASAYTQWTAYVAAAAETDNKLFDEIFFQSPWVLGGLAPKSILCLVGFLGLGIAGWKSRAIPRSAAFTLIGAAVLSIWPPYPPGVIAASLAFFLIARTGATARA